MRRKERPPRRSAKPAQANVEAKLSVGPRAPKDERARVRDLEKRLAEALEQQTATGTILEVISRSPTALQPVLDQVAESAARVCGADDAMIRLIDGGALRLVAHHGPLPDLDERIPLDRGSATGRAISDRRPVHLHDLGAEAEAEFPIGRALQRRFGHRTVLAVPLLREGVAIGGINIRRTEVRPFADRQVALLQTFADQAVIAIENVRLFTELQEKNHALTQAHGRVTESLERQTATAGILKVISESPTDVQPVFDAIAVSAARLCDAVDSTIFRVDGDQLGLVAHEGPISSQPVGPFSALTPGRPSSRAVLEARTIHVVDLQTEVDEYPEGSALARIHDFRTVLSVPLIRGTGAIGVIAIRRTEARPFTDQQIELLQTFADQAVIAIENVRLFKELEARNADLTDALARETATSDILRVISSSLTDVQPVLDAVAESAARLCGAFDATIFHREGDRLRLVAHHGPMAIRGPPVKGSFRWSAAR